jgi:hypothetical protein
MKRWDQRPFEVRNLFNPAFCGVVLFRALQGFEEENPGGMPFSLCLLVLPLCLQRVSREIIAESPRSHLLSTIENHPQILVGFADRTSALMPFSFEGLGVLMERGCFTVSQGGHLITVDKTVRKTITGTSESISCQRVARIVGREFARIADRVTIYTSLGIRP